MINKLISRIGAPVLLGAALLGTAFTAAPEASAEVILPGQYRPVPGCTEVEDFLNRPQCQELLRWAVVVSPSDGLAVPVVNLISLINSSLK